MTYTSFLDTIMRHAGFTETEDAARTARATLGVLRECLDESQCSTLAAELPEQLAPLLRGGRHTLVGSNVRGFVAQVARQENISRGFAVEHVMVVCRALAELVGPAVAAMPPPLAELFEVPVTTSSPAPSVHGAGHHLADGRPGSRHPLSESTATRAQQGSVVASPEPHADRKLSSGHVEVEDAVSEVGPGSEHPISRGG